MTEGVPRRRLSPGLIAFIAVDVVLVALLVVFFVMSQSRPGPSVESLASPPAGSVSAPPPDAKEPEPTSQATGGETAEPEPEPSPTPSVLDIPSPTPAATDLLADVGGETFQLPSGNIACAIGGGQVTCIITNTNEATTTDATCSGGVIGHAVTLGADGSISRPCTVPNPGIPSTSTLGYGQTMTVEGITCSSSREEGVRCVSDATGAGFTLARRGLATF